MLYIQARYSPSSILPLLCSIHFLAPPAPKMLTSKWHCGDTGQQWQAWRGQSPRHWAALGLGGQWHDTHLGQGCVSTLGQVEEPCMAWTHSPPCGRVPLALITPFPQVPVEVAPVLPLALTALTTPSPAPFSPPPTPVSSGIGGEKSQPTTCGGKGWWAPEAACAL